MEALYVVRCNRDLNCLASTLCAAEIHAQTHFQFRNRSADFARRIRCDELVDIRLILVPIARASSTDAIEIFVEN